MPAQAIEVQAGYDPYLDAFQRAFAPELRGIVRRYRLTRRSRVLDVPCGDGFYAALFARQMRGGMVVAADASAGCVAAAEAAVPSTADGPRVEFCRADAYALPFSDASFDLVWCAQSMITLDDPVAALREMGRVVRPGGRVGVLETDEFHHVVLPWPVGLELALLRAVRESCRRRYGRGDKFAQSRRLRAAFLGAGLTPLRRSTIAADRHAPFGPSEREFLARHFGFLGETVARDLGPAEADAFARFTDPDGPESFFHRPDAELTVLMTVGHARRPADAS